MTKDELMKYANDPFWVRLRWILFIAFWLLWVGMLAGAIYIIFDAPKCSAPKPLAWYKEGPLIVLPPNASNDTLDKLAKHVNEQGIKGVIYEVPGDDTYFLDATQKVKIEHIVAKFKSAKVIVDLTPNYILETDQVMLDFIDLANMRDAVISERNTRPPNNWLTRENKAAWQTYHDEYQILSHYGEKRYDLQMSSSIAKDKFKAVLSQLSGWGVKGFRLNNANHYIISKSHEDDQPKPNTNPSGFAVNGELQHLI
jgi:solute carrier family 3, member 2